MYWFVSDFRKFWDIGYIFLHEQSIFKGWLKYWIRWESVKELIFY